MTTESIDLLLVAVKLLRMHNYGVYLNLSVTTIVYVVPAAYFLHTKEGVREPWP